MKPITTVEELGRLEDILRLSERRAISKYVRSCREDDTDRPTVQVFDVLADKIEQGAHWDSSLPTAGVHKVIPPHADNKLKRLDDFIATWRARIVEKSYHLQDPELFGQLLTLNTLMDFRRDQETRDD